RTPIGPDGDGSESVSATRQMLGHASQPDSRSSRQVSAFRGAFVKLLMDYRLVIVRAGKRDMTDKQAFTIAFDAFFLGWPRALRPVPSRVGPIYCSAYLSTCGCGRARTGGWAGDLRR